METMVSLERAVDALEREALPTQHAGSVPNVGVGLQSKDP